MPNLKNKMQLQQLTLTADGTGGNEGAWTNVKTLWGEVSDGVAERYFNEGQEYNGIIYKVTVRGLSFNYAPPLQNYRLVLYPFGSSNILKILDAKNDDLKKMWVVLTCISAPDTN